MTNNQVSNIQSSSDPMYFNENPRTLMFRCAKLKKRTTMVQAIVTIYVLVSWKYCNKLILL